MIDGLDTPELKRSRLITALRSLTPQMQRKLQELKDTATRRRERTDLIWELLLRSASSLGGVRGEQKLFGSPELLEPVTFERLASLPAEKRREQLEHVFRRANVRYPKRKATQLSANIDKILAMGGLTAAREKALKLTTREAKLSFMRSFDGIGDKYARNVWMDLYDLAFRDAIAVDKRILRITKGLGRSFGTYEEYEVFYRAIAAEAELEPWEVDRVLFEFEEQFLRVVEQPDHAETS